MNYEDPMNYEDIPKEELPQIVAELKGNTQGLFALGEKHKAVLEKFKDHLTFRMSCGWERVFLYLSNNQTIYRLSPDFTLPEEKPEAANAHHDLVEENEKLKGKIKILQTCKELQNASTLLGREENERLLVALKKTETELVHQRWATSSLDVMTFVRVLLQQLKEAKAKLEEEK